MSDEKQVLIDLLMTSNLSQLCNFIVLTPFSVIELRILNKFLGLNLPDFPAKDVVLSNLLMKCTQIPRDGYSVEAIIFELDHFLRMFDLQCNWNDIMSDETADTIAADLVSNAIDAALDQVINDVSASDQQVEQVLIGNESLPHDFQETSNSQITNSQIQNESLPSEFQSGDSLPELASTNISMEQHELPDLTFENTLNDKEMVVENPSCSHVDNQKLNKSSAESDIFDNAETFQLKADAQPDRLTSQIAPAEDDVQMLMEDATKNEREIEDDVQESPPAAAKLNMVAEKMENIEEGECCVSIADIPGEAVKIAPAAEKMNVFRNSNHAEDEFILPSQDTGKLQSDIPESLSAIKENADAILNSPMVGEVAEDVVMEFEDNPIQVSSPTSTINGQEYVSDRHSMAISVHARETTPTPCQPPHVDTSLSQNFLIESQDNIDVVLDSQRVGEVAEDSLMEFDDSQIQFSSPGCKKQAPSTPGKSLIVNFSEPPSSTSVRFQEISGFEESKFEDDEKSLLELDSEFGVSQSLYYDSQPSLIPPTGITAPNPTPVAIRSGAMADTLKHDELKPLDECWNTLRTKLYQSYQNADADTRVQQLRADNQDNRFKLAKLEQELLCKTESISSLADSFAENRFELNDMRNQVQVDLESAQVEATSTFALLKDEVSAKFHEIQSQYESQLQAINIQKADELQVLAAEKLELLPLKEKVAMLSCEIESLRNINAELNLRVEQSLAEQVSIKAMEVDHIKFTEEIACFQTLVDRKQQQIDDLTAQVLNLQSCISELQIQLSNASEKLKNSSPEDIKQLQLKVQFYEKKIVDLTSTIEFAQQEQDSTSYALKEVSDQKIVVEKNLSELQLQSEKLNTEYTSVLKSLENANANTESRVKEVENQYSSQLENTVLQLERIQSLYEGDKLRWEAANAQLDTLNKSLQVDLQNNESIIHKLESENSQKLNALKSEIDRLNEDCRSKSVGLDGALAEIATLSRNYDISVARVQELEGQLANRTNATTEALNSCSALNERLAALEESKVEMKAEFDRLASQAKLHTDSEIERLSKHNDELLEKLQNSSKPVEGGMESISNERLTILEDERNVLMRQRDDINTQNSHFVKENAVLKQNIQKLMEDMVKIKENAVSNSTKAGEIASAPPATTTRLNKKRSLSNATMISIPEDHDSPMRFQPAAQAPDPKKSKPSPKHDDEILVIEPKVAPVKKKKRRESTSLDQIQQLRDENSAPDLNGEKDSTPVKNSGLPASTPESALSTRKSRSSATSMFIGISGFKDSNETFNYKARDDIIKAIKKLPNAKFLTGNEGKDHYDHRMTHIITPPETKTLKALGAILSGAWIIQDPEWIYKSALEGKWVEEDLYGFRLSSSPFEAKKLFMAPNFASLSSKGKKQNSMWPEFLKLLWVDCSKGVIVGSPKNADYVIRTEGDDLEYGKAKVIDWHSFMDLIPSKRQL